MSLQQKFNAEYTCGCAESRADDWPDEVCALHGVRGQMLVRFILDPGTGECVIVGECPDPQRDVTSDA